MRFWNGTRVPTNTGVPPRISGSLWTTAVGSDIRTSDSGTWSSDTKQDTPDLINNWYENIAAAVTTSRGFTRAHWDSIINTQGNVLPRDAVALGLADSVGSFDQAKRAARTAARRATADTDAALLADVTGNAVWGPEEWGDAPRIAVLYAIGPCDMDTGIRGRLP